MNQIPKSIALFLGAILLCLGNTLAQNPVRTEPEVFTIDDSVTIFYNANYGNKALRNFREDIFLYAGVITQASTSETDWKNVTPSHWAAFPESSRLTRSATDSNVYSIRILPRSYFNIPTGTFVKSLKMLFRNNGAILVGRETRNADIAYPVKTQGTWWNEAIFYEIFVRSFQDSNGDGIGDFPGLTSRLGYLKELGINAIWLMPISSSPTYHGYDVINYKSINPQYGTMAQFEQFLDSAHSLGIKVVIDFVMNHSSTQHNWFQQSARRVEPYTNFYRWSETQPTALGPLGTVAWHWNATRRQYYYGAFFSGMPDLNYDNPAVKDSIFDASRFWLQKGVDGFRIDAVQYLVETGGQQANTAQSLAICREFNQFIKTINPEAMTVGEVWSNLNNMLLYRNRLDYCFEFNLAEFNAQAARNNDSVSVRNLRNYTQGINYNNYPNQQYGNFLTNHDQNRIFGVLGQSILKSKIAATLLLTTPGLPYLYYGEEIGMSGTGVDEEKRLPMPWSTSTRGAGSFTTGNPWRTTNQNNNSRNVASMNSDPNSLLNHYKKLIQLRANNSTLNKGEFRFLTVNSPLVIAIERRYGNKTLYVICNVGTVAVEGLSVNLMHEYLNPESTNFLNLMDSSVANYYLGPDNNAIYGMQLAPGEVKILEVTNSPVTSAKSEATLGAIQLYPNPVLNELYILLPEVANQKKVTIQITDLQGRIIQQSDEQVEGKQISLKLANTMKTGTYLVTVITDKGIFNKKVVKQ